MRLSHSFIDIWRLTKFWVAVICVFPAWSKEPMVDHFFKSKPFWSLFIHISLVFYAFILWYFFFKMNLSILLNYWLMFLRPRKLYYTVQRKYMLDVHYSKWNYSSIHYEFSINDSTITMIKWMFSFKILLSSRHVAIKMPPNISHFEHINLFTTSTSRKNAFKRYDKKYSGCCYPIPSKGKAVSYNITSHPHPPC